MKGIYYCINNKKEYFSKNLLFIFALFFFCAGYLYGTPIIKDNDSFVIYDTTAPLAQTIKVNRSDDVREFVQKSTRLSYRLNYNNLSYTTNIFEIPMSNYFSPDDSGYKNDGRLLKITRDSNNDIYIAGNRYAENSDTPQGYDTILKYSNNVLAWSISPSTSTAEPVFIRPQGLIIPKNKDFLYAIYYGNETSDPCKIAIYKIYKNTGEYSLIYSSSVTKYMSNNYHNNTEFLVDNDANIYILTKDKSFFIEEVKLQKIDSDGKQVFTKEIRNAYNCGERKLMLLENGLIFILAYSSEYAKDAVALADKFGEVVHTVSISDTYVSNAVKEERKILVGADKDAMYYLCGDLKEQPDGTKLGFEKLVQYDYSGQVIKTIYLPGKVDAQYGSNDDITAYENSNNMTTCFVQNKRLYVPSMLNGNKHYGYIVDINNPPVSLRFSGDSDYEDNVIGKFKAVEGTNAVAFKVKYKNFNGKPPSLHFPIIRIYLNNIEISGSPFSMTAVDESDTDYAKGVEYKADVPLVLKFNEVNNMYTYDIKVEDDDENSFTSDRYTIYEPSFVKDNKAFNYPNPFNPNKTSTKIVFHTPKTENVKIKIYSLNGKKIFEDNFNAAAGQNEYEYKGRDGNGKALYNGVYVCVIEKSGGNAKCKIAVVK
ncbi:MAG: T9SS type A sorting domain-containing protein [Endomicrobium sp.]|jgi:hypothetical protein|nr:T9SS type A sorting domain-containing protein [Endomicrobium sp.]